MYIIIIIIIIIIILWPNNHNVLGKHPFKVLEDGQSLVTALTKKINITVVRARFRNEL